MSIAQPPTQQLILPMPGIADGTSTGSSIPRKDRVFVNRNLQLSGIDWIGFDMDYTLAVYNQREMDALSIAVTVERMVERGYPTYLKRATYDARFPIRGLLIDKRHGHVLKMNRYKGVLKGYHGLQPLAAETLRELYHDKKLRPHTRRYHWIDTLFALCEVTAFAVIVDAMEKRGDRVDYGQLFDDIRTTIDEAHRDGVVHSRIAGELNRYVNRDPHLARTLHKLRSAGKKLFVLTNSPWGYTDTIMSYLLTDAMPEYPTWQHFFDVVIASAQKPAFFMEGRPLMQRDGDVLRHASRQLERGKVYEGGNLRDFERGIGAVGSAILYVGDHIYGDILRSKKESSWRTAMIIQELDMEIAAHEACDESMARQRQLEEERNQLEDELRFYQGRFKTLSRKGTDTDTGAERVRVKRAIERIRGSLRNAEREHALIAATIDRCFHPYWGSLLKEHNEMSSFGLQVETYADIYTRSVSTLYAYSPQQFFRSPHDLMPHEL